jgi:hypothetical protein
VFSFENNGRRGEVKSVEGFTLALVNVPQWLRGALLVTVNPVFGIYTLMIAAQSLEAEVFKRS